MKKLYVLSVTLLAAFAVINCKQSDKSQEETILKGQATVLVDQTFKPVVEDQVLIFEDRYPAKIKITAQPEAEIIQSLAQDHKKIAVLSRKLTAQEIKYFNSQKIYPKLTPFAKDAIALIVKKNSSDTLISIKQIVALMQGKSVANFKGLVFDNPNSSAARQLFALAGIDKIPEKGVFSFNTTEEVFNYVSHNSSMIGVVGINFIFEPSNQIQDNLSQISILSVENTRDGQYYFPSQDHIAGGKYPLARDLFVVNCQGYTGLGMGFASFVAGEVGQRIVLKSGLVPEHFPSRKILIRNTITNEKK